MPWLPTWLDSLTGVVHIVGVHKRIAGRTEVYADCDFFIAEAPGMDGFYSGNVTSFVTCIACLGLSNFGTYAPR